jgi:hypothetical protein
MENQFDLLNNFLLNNYGIYDYCFFCDDYDSDVILQLSPYHVKFYNHIRPPTYIILKDMMLKNNLSIDWRDKSFSFFKETSVSEIAANMWATDKRIVFGDFYPVPQALIPGRVFLRFLDLVRLDYQDTMYQPYFGW